MKKEKPVLQYYSKNQDIMWQREAEKLIPWIRGDGIDIGSGIRTIFPDILRVDANSAVNPDIKASGDKLPLKDNSKDFIVSIHSFEHFPDSRKVMTEWLRVIKPGGYICIVHPDIQYTKKQNVTIDSAGLKANPYNKHWNEHTRKSFLKMLKEFKDLEFKLVDSGEACPEWSFYIILRKTC